MLPFATAGSNSGIFSSLLLCGFDQTDGSFCDTSVDVPLRDAAGSREVWLFALLVWLCDRSVPAVELEAPSKDLFLDGSANEADLHGGSANEADLHGGLTDAATETSALSFSDLSSSLSVMV